MPVTKYTCEWHILQQDLHFNLLNIVASDTINIQ